MDKFFSVLTPNAAVGPRDKNLIGFFWVGLGLILWQLIKVPFLPRPSDLMTAFEPLRQQGVLLEFGISIWTMIEAIFWSCVVSLGFAYASVIPAIKPVARFLSGWRRFGLVGLLLFFTLMAPDSHTLKIMILTFSITGFYLRDMLSVVDAIPQAEYDHARTLGMSQARIIYEVVILGTLAEALESLRVNAAMGWMMLTAVEGYARSEGGIGVALLNMSRHMDLAAIGVVLVCLYFVGAVQDWVIGAFRDYIVCPYARIGRAN